MSQKINTNEFLKNVRIGLWRIEVEEEIAAFLCGRSNG